MPALTRRRYPERQDCWQIYYGDVCAGTIARRTGCPVDVDQWEWGCGFYPGTRTGQGENGTAKDLEACRIEFEAAWRRLLPTVTEADFQVWRDQRDWTAWKYEMRDRGCHLPTEFTSGRSRCFCGAPIDIGGMDSHVKAAHRGAAAA